MTLTATACDAPKAWKYEKGVCRCDECNHLRRQRPDFTSTRPTATTHASPNAPTATWRRP